MTNAELYYNYAPKPLRKLWYSTCVNKDKYPSEAKAVKAVGRVFSKYGNKTKHYLCPFCSKYHLTSAG